MNKTKIQLTDDQIKRILRIAKIVDAGDMALVEEIFNLERQVELVAKALNDGLQYAVRIAETTQKLPGKPGKDGVDYVLTDGDKDAIAKSIKIPIIEKVIEKTTEVVIKEVPVVSEKIIETIREEKLPQEALDEIERLTLALEELKKTISSRGSSPKGSGSRPIRVFNNGTEISQNVLELNFTNASALTTTGQVGRRVNITIGGSGSQQPLSGTLGQTTFVWATAPTVIVVDQGRAMQKVSSD